jgi:DNA polymerase-1
MHEINADHDTILLHYCLNENEGGHDLKALSRRFLGADVYDEDIDKITQGKTRMDLAPKELLYQYLAQDCDYTLQLFNLFHLEVVNNPSTNFLYHKILMPGVNFLRRVTLNGFMVDKVYLKKYEIQLTKEINTIKDFILQNYGHLYDRETYMRETNAKSAPEELNIGSHYQLAWLLYDKLKLKPSIKTKVEKSTDKQVLGSLIDAHPIIPELLKYSEKIKILNTYVKGIQKKINSDDRLRSTFNLQTTVTGRLSSEKPNIQNIPRNKDVKNIFTVPDGKVLIEADFKGVELRVLAHLSQDTFLLDCFKKGLDLHDEMSKAIFGNSFTKEQRVAVKGVNFGVAYGRKAKSIAQEFKISEKAAQQIINDWFDKAKGAKAYMDNCIKMLKNKEVFITPFGRQRRFGLITGDEHQENEARNFAIQSTASDLLLLSAMKLEDLIKPYGGIIVNLVHDSILIEAPNELNKCQNIINLINTTMQEIPKLWLNPVIPFPVEISAGFTWGTMKSVELT